MRREFARARGSLAEPAPRRRRAVLALLREPEVAGRRVDANPDGRDRPREPPPGPPRVPGRGGGPALADLRAGAGSGRNRGRGAPDPGSCVTVGGAPRPAP